jgi:hypothetical protein
MRFTHNNVDLQPQGGSWKLSHDNEKVDLDKIPMIKPLIDRFDLILKFKDNRMKTSLQTMHSKNLKWKIGLHLTILLSCKTHYVC